jgi:hypothetical protein
MGITLVDGRDFTEADDWRVPLVALVSQHLAETLWPGRSPLGQMIRVGNDSPENPWHRVIGVVGDTRWNATERSGAGGEVYSSYRQWPTPKLHLLVRTRGDPRLLVPEIRRIVRDVNPENAITYIRTMDGILDDALWGTSVRRTRKRFRRLSKACSRRRPATCTSSRARTGTSEPPSGSPMLRSATRDSIQ